MRHSIKAASLVLAALQVGISQADARECTATNNAKACVIKVAALKIKNDECVVLLPKSLKHTLVGFSLKKEPATITWQLASYPATANYAFAKISFDDDPTGNFDSEQSGTSEYSWRNTGNVKGKDFKYTISVKDPSGNDCHALDPWVRN